MGDYDVNRDGPDGFALGYAVMREIGVREGRFAPLTDNERRWAAEGPREVRELESVRTR